MPGLWPACGVAMVTGHEGVGLEAERCHDQLVGRYADSFAVANEARPKGRALAAEAIALWPGCCRSVMARTATREPGSGGQPLWMFLPERAPGSRAGRGSVWLAAPVRVRKP